MNKKVSINPLFFGIIAFFMIVERSFLPLYIFLSAVIHEAGHLAALKAFGFPVEGLSVRAFGICIAVSKNCKSYVSEIAAAAAGPAANLFAAVAVLIFNRFILYTPNGPFVIAVNLLLFAINLLPVRLLDGGRILEAALLSTNLDFETSQRITGALSYIFSAALAAGGAYLFFVSRYNFTLLAIGIYLLCSLIFGLER